MGEQGPILASGLAQVKNAVEPLEDDDKAVVVATGDNAGVRVGAAVDLGKGFEAGGHVEKSSAGWGWFAGLAKRWKK